MLNLLLSQGKKLKLQSRAEKKKKKKKTEINKHL